MSQNDQLEFINWLQKKTNAKSDSELEQIVQEMGEDKINEMYAQFKASKSRSFKVGGVIDYVRCLRKKGGKMTKGCMCGGKMDAKTAMKAIGGKIVDGKDTPKQDIKEGKKTGSSIGKMREDSEKTKTKVYLPKKNPRMPNPNSKEMMAHGGKMRADETKGPVVPKSLKEPVNKQKKAGIKERKYLK